MKGLKMEKEIKIKGMTCGHCEGRVKQVLLKFPEVTDAVVSAEKQSAVITLLSDVSSEDLRAAVNRAGYSLES